MKQRPRDNERLSVSRTIPKGGRYTIVQGAGVLDNFCGEGGLLAAQFCCCERQTQEQAFTVRMEEMAHSVFRAGCTMMCRR